MLRFVTDRKLLFRRLFLIVLDVFSVILAAGLGLALRFDFQYDSEDAIMMIGNYWKYLPILVVVTLVLFNIFRLYSSIWKFAGINEMEHIVLACCADAFLYFLGSWVITKWIQPRTVYVFFFFLLVLFVTITRFGYRFIRYNVRRAKDREYGNNVMVVGAGEAGNMIIREMNANELTHKYVQCVVDDAVDKQGTFIQGIKVSGTSADIPSLVVTYSITEIIIAIPSASSDEVARITNICKDTGCAMKILPGIHELVDGCDVRMDQLRAVSVEDLLGREPVEIDLNSVMSYITGRTVLVTGGGGSIGSELCRQMAAHGVGHLIIVDISENNAYDIQQELIRRYPEMELTVLIASVRNTLRINKIFEEYKPEIVFHAAAHKHVPLMEESPNEAIKNNVFGTLKTVRAAAANGVEKFVFISTDKAVNPTNIMGASKRMCEMIIQAYNRRSDTDFVAVRFGNVLGSNGSVIPLFKKQIADGGPVTVTDPEIIRYFMTIPEAVSLVLQAGAYAKGGEVFVLDMGKPVKILELAENLIRLSGYIPYEEIEIKFIGLRPGEKLYEEMLMSEEGLTTTDNKRIYVGHPIDFDPDKYIEQLDELYKSVITEPENIKSVVASIVPTYHPEKGGAAAADNN